MEVFKLAKNQYNYRNNRYYKRFSNRGNQNNNQSDNTAQGNSIFRNGKIDLVEGICLASWSVIALLSANIGTWIYDVTNPQLLMGGVVVMLIGFFSGKSRRSFSQSRQEITLVELGASVLAIALLAGWTGYWTIPESLVEFTSGFTGFAVAVGLYIVAVLQD